MGRTINGNTITPPCGRNINVNTIVLDPGLARRTAGGLCIDEPQVGKASGDW
jgi:hypothetical protein